MTAPFCAGRGQCHGSLAWCAACGGVDDVCSAVDCDTHGRRGGRSIRLAEVLQELNTPEVMDFIKGIRLEAAHQRERWGTDHDAGKTDADWFWLVGYLAGKALHKPEKRLHHLVTCAAALANWHLHSLGKTNMRPGIAPPSGEGAAS
jgi:hypothetical protein